MSDRMHHEAAFEHYWRMGPARSIERLYAALQVEDAAPGLRTLSEWSSRYTWQARIARLEREAQQADDEARIQALREMHERHAKEALLLQQKGAEWLAAKSADDASAEASIRAIVEGARMERLARGEPTDRQEVQGGLQINARLEGLSDDELDRLIEHAEGALGGEGAASP
jgi:hypothetical protein